MNGWELTTPIAFFVFNRPDVTEKVFMEIAKAKPSRLFIIADGPRENREDENQKCIAVRKIVDKIDWNCEVLKNFSDINLGCKKRVSNGLDWVFSQAEEAIILEDDCLPNPTFFRFCEELLEKYRDDKRIMVVSGDNFQHGYRRTIDSYYYSRYVHIWGWASWRRAWKYYDVNMSLWPEARDGNWLIDVLGSKKEAQYWEQIFEKMYHGEIDTWDYQWAFACWLQGGLTILPNINLVKNIGFGAGATHLKGQSKLANLDIKSMLFPLSHPLFMIRDSEADKKTGEEQFSLKSFSARVLKKMESLIRGL